MPVLRSSLVHLALTTAIVTAGCVSPPAADDDSAPEVPAPTRAELTVTVTLDGEPAPLVTLSQGGRPTRWSTGDDGRAALTVDLTLDADLYVIASHPEARQAAVRVDLTDPTAALSVALTRFDPVDNPEYSFKDPGEPDRSPTTAQCGHCHVTINADWAGSLHRDAARDPQVQDLYAGAASALDETSCATAGGQWLAGFLPGGDPGSRCFLGAGALPSLNPCSTPDCAEAEQFGACADCHAPGIDGALGGRDLRDAVGHAYDYGVHCDVCHRVEDVDLSAPAGVAGALRLLRPGGPPTFGSPWTPLTFGPYDDVPTGVMGAVQRDHFLDPRLCAGCHELAQEVLVPGASADLSRWPDGRLPIHTTFSEWSSGPMAPDVPCQACHMPPDPDVSNAADLQLLDIGAGLVGGWERPPGSVRRHTFDGPDCGTGALLRLAAALNLVVSQDGGQLTATATVRNAAAGHAIPTGEPLRSLLLAVEARCGDTSLSATSGFAIPDLGGALQVQGVEGDWTLWPGATVGQVVRVLSLSGGYHDYAGVGPFGDGTFDATAKGLPLEEVRGEAVIVAMDGDVAQLSTALPPGDLAVLGEPAQLEQGSPAEALRGAAGFGFGKVLVAPDGARQVPHFLAVDVASDNRLSPGQSWEGSWTFAAPCGDPVVTASLLYRPWPLALARERGWEMPDLVIAQVSR